MDKTALFFIEEWDALFTRAQIADAVIPPYLRFTSGIIHSDYMTFSRGATKLV